MTTRGIDPTIYNHAEIMATLSAHPHQPRLEVERLADAFQRAFEDWAEDVEAAAAAPQKGRR